MCSCVGLRAVIQSYSLWWLQFAGYFIAAFKAVRGTSFHSVPSTHLILFGCTQKIRNVVFVDWLLIEIRRVWWPFSRLCPFSATWTCWRYVEPAWLATTTAAIMKVRNFMILCVSGLQPNQNNAWHHLYPSNSILI
jgi:hypothetical protein